jgi:hypothetical protein
VLRRRPRHRHPDPAGLTRSTGRWALGSALLALALSLGACGEESSDPSIDVTELVPSRTDYIIDADTICARFEAGMRTEAEVRLGIDANDFRLTRSGEIVFKAGRAPSQAALRRFGTRTLIPALRDQLEDLRALTGPGGGHLVSVSDAPPTSEEFAAALREFCGA